MSDRRAHLDAIAAKYDLQTLRTNIVLVQITLEDKVKTCEEEIMRLNGEVARLTNEGNDLVRRANEAVTQLQQANKEIELQRQALAEQSAKNDEKYNEEMLKRGFMLEHEENLLLFFSRDTVEYEKAIRSAEQLFSKKTGSGKEREQACRDELAAQRTRYNTKKAKFIKERELALKNAMKLEALQEVFDQMYSEGVFEEEYVEPEEREDRAQRKRKVHEGNKLSELAVMKRQRDLLEKQIARVEAQKSSTVDVMPQ